VAATTGVRSGYRLPVAEARSPAETVAVIDSAAVDKSRLPAGKLGVMSILGGIFIATGALLAIVVAGSALDLQQANPGLARFVLGAVFPVGFIAVVLTGAGLFTSDCATQMVPWYRRRVTAATVLRVLVVAYAGNVIGAVGLAVLGWLGGILAEGQPWTPYLLDLGAGKVSHSWGEVFVKGILANMLVCVAAWQAYSARSTTGKVIGIWFPVMAFVALGTEHSIANLFFIPAAMLSGADITVAQFLTANLIPATLGNWVGGALLIGLPYAWLYAQDRASAPA
jgi:formate/nitrite transporter